MFSKILRASWNPKHYGVLRETSIGKLAWLILLVAALSSAVCMLLLLPTIAQLDTNLEKLARTTNVTITAHLSQSEPSYLLRNPDVLITTGTGDAIVTITPKELTVKRFLFFGAKSYDWTAFSSLETVPGNSVLLPIAVFLLPSLMFWSLLLLLTSLCIAALLFVLIYGIILHVQNVSIHTAEIAKVSLLASIPSFFIFAVAPILRLGLPIAVIAGFMLALWLTLALLGISTITERNSTKFSGKA